VGGRHANANFPAFLPGCLSDEVIAAALASALHRSGHGADLLLLERMSDERTGLRSPLLELGADESPNLALAAQLQPVFADFLRQPKFKNRMKKHRAQTRKFDAAGGWRRIEAASEAEVSHLLDAFFGMKAERFRHAGIADVFAEAPVKEAFRSLFGGALRDPAPRFRIQGLEVGGRLRAVTGTSYGADRVTCEFGAISNDELAKQSPGEFLFHLNIAEACERGAAIYDFGVGDEPYKRAWCDTEMRHWDAMAPLTVQGQILAGMLRGSARLKGALKRSPVLWQAFKRLRRQTAGVQDAGNED
jgi:CelD/BcsL family acetyltransferase involved in cellulose biosynthesis